MDATQWKSVKHDVGVCLAGYGNWGRNLARNFHQLGALRAICESNPAHLESMSQTYPGVKIYNRYEEALQDRDCSAVVLATPAEQHYPMALQALDSGRDVYVEKPLALDPDEGMHMISRAEQGNRILMVGHLLRYHPAVVKIAQLIDSGYLGKIDYVYSNRLSMGKIRHEENALWSFAPHDISVILALIGQMPVQVTAVGGAYLQPNIADVTVSSLLFEKGTRSHIFVSWLHPHKEQRLVVIGSKKTVVFEDTRPDKKLIEFDRKIEWRNGNLEASKAEGRPIEFAGAEPLRLECEHFLDSVATRRKPLTCGAEGLRVLRVLQACQRSLQMGGEPVQVEQRPMLRIVNL